MIQRIARLMLQKIKVLKPILEFLIQIECRIATKWTSSAHKRLMSVQWRIRPHPDHFDHNIDLFYKWLETRSPLWLERGVFGGLALKEGSLLELSCGDGFNAKNFYSLRSRHVIACDFDPKAIKTANDKNTAPNVDFVLADIRTDMPQGEFDNIVWDAAIEPFTKNEIAKIIRDIKDRLTEHGILSGYTIISTEKETVSSHDHDYKFENKKDLMDFFATHFNNVTVFETQYPDRHNLYFWASNGHLPFSSEWSQVINYRALTSS